MGVAITILHAQGVLLRLLPASHHRRSGSRPEVLVHLVGEVVAVIEIFTLELGYVLATCGGPVGLPLTAQFLDFLLVVQVRIIVLADTANALPQRQMLRVDGNPVILGLAASANICPATLLLLEIKPRCIRKEDNGQNHTSQAE